MTSRLKNPITFERWLRTKPESFFLKRGEAYALSLFSDASKRVPAYKDFLLRHHIEPGRVKKIQEFADTVPLINKDSYLRTHELSSLCWDGQLTKGQYTISATSGSTGEPFYFPRTLEQDLQYALTAELYLRSNFQIHKKSTLYIIGWGMGVWIGGVFSYAAARIVAQRGSYPLSIITPGTSGEEILNAVQRLGPSYDQVIIGGYPPMIKDVIDEGIRRNMNWKSYPVKFIFSAEGFSESFRDYIAKQTGLASIYTDTLNHYGTVDMGTMAHETPLSILVRRLALKNPELNSRLFGQPYRQPTFAQYIPEVFYFESVNNAVVCTSRSGLPLIRYDLIDTGGVRTLSDVYIACQECGINLDEEIHDAGIAKTVWHLPFVYVYERRDFTIKVYGANIYPQEIRHVLEQRLYAEQVSGKHTAEVSFDDELNQTWTVHIELQPGKTVEPAFSQQLQADLVESLCLFNSEFANNVKSMGKKRMTPIVVPWEHKSAPHFSSPGKHKWVKKTLS